MYPSLNPSAWEPLYTAASKYPQLTFNAVVNIANGPSPNPVSDTNYITSITSITTLHTHPNINTLGYVHIRVSPTGTSNLRPTSDIIGEITQYSTWNLPSSNIQRHDIHLNGIFMDEAPADVRNYTYMSTLTAATRSHSFSPAIFDSGGSTCRDGFWGVVYRRSG